MFKTLTRLYIVATPIGNLGDISARAISVLSDVDLIAAEDTRHTGSLLKHLNISTEMMRLDDHSERTSLDRVIHRLHGGDAVALVSDAGTPLISDPGYLLVKACVSAGIEVVPIPGPSAVTAALSASGLPTDKFVFEGFLSAKSVARKTRLEALAGEPRTLVLFEAPHRILACLTAIAEVMGDNRVVCVCRELTKTFEQIVTSPVVELVHRVESGDIPTKGEFVVIIAGSADEATFDHDELLQALLAELSPSRAAAVAAGLTGQPKKRLYERALALKA